MDRSGASPRFLRAPCRLQPLATKTCLRGCLPLAFGATGRAPTAAGGAQYIVVWVADTAGWRAQLTCQRSPGVEGDRRGRAVLATATTGPLRRDGAAVERAGRPAWATDARSRMRTTRTKCACVPRSSRGEPGAWLHQVARRGRARVVRAPCARQKATTSHARVLRRSLSAFECGARGACDRAAWRR